MNMKEAGRVQEKIREIEDSIRTDLDRDKGKLFRDRYIPLDPDAIRPGDRVFIVSLEKEGTLEAIDCVAEDRPRCSWGAPSVHLCLRRPVPARAGQPRPAP